MTRVLLVCPEPLGHGQPAGIGIRFLEIARVLRDANHDVTLLGRDDITPEALVRATAEADVAVVQGHVANDLFAHGRAIPTVVDLYDPFIIENLHYYATRGGEVFTHDHATLVNSLLRGDFFLCASEAQRHFWLGMLLALGRVNPIAFEDDPRLERLIAIAPFGVPPPREGAVRAANRDVLFGGIYDWYDPILAIEAVALARAATHGVTLTFTHHPNPSLTPQGKLAEAMEHVRANGYEEFIRFEPWVPYDERESFFARFSLALLTFPQSIETDLSMRTRIYDYLWVGLPVVTSSAPGTDELLERYHAGIVVREDDPSSLATAMLHAFEDVSLFSGTQRFAAEHAWERTLAPLVAFCDAPRTGAGKEEFATRPQVPEQQPRSIIDRIKRRIGGQF